MDASDQLSPTTPVPSLPSAKDAEGPRTLDAWTIQPFDPKTGKSLDADEMAYRLRIRDEHEQGYVGVDALYHAAQEVIHQPLLDERGEVVDTAWVLRRANHTNVRVVVGEMGTLQSLEGDLTAIERAAVAVARMALGNVAADVMKALYQIANDPPNWRRPEFTLHLSDLLDKLGYSRDDRGVHRSKNRQTLSKTLLALHYAHIGVQGVKDGENVGFVAPLLASLEYRTREPVAHLTPIEVFEQGLPEVVTVAINQKWYRLREADGRPAIDYALVPRTELLPPGQRVRSGRRITPAMLLREHVARYRTEGHVQMTRAGLLTVGGIKDRNVTHATKTLSRALDTLRDEGTLTTYEPRPLPLNPNAFITLTWDRT